MSAAGPVAKQLHDLLADWYFRNANLVPLGRVDADLYRRVGEVLRDVGRHWNELSLAGVTDERRYNDLHEAAAQAYRNLLDEIDGKRPTGKARAGNLLELTGQVWHIWYKDRDEAGDFKDQANGVMRDLARLLAEPDRRFGAQEFHPPPSVAAPLLHFGRDDASDEEAINSYREEMIRLVREIKGADDAHDTDEAERLREEFRVLEQRVTADTGRRGRKRRCGTLAPLEKADQNLRMKFKNLKARLRAKGMPKLADHLDKCLGNSGCEWWYMPTPGTSAWHVSRPDSPREE
jgi:hypothetical protein